MDTALPVWKIPDQSLIKKENKKHKEISKVEWGIRPVKYDGYDNFHIWTRLFLSGKNTTHTHTRARARSVTEEENKG